MKKLLFIAVLILGFSVTAMAQDEFPRGEVFLGYAYFGCDNTVFGSSLKQNCTYDGWDFSIVLNGTKNLSFVTDFGGYYNRDKPLPGYMDHYHAYTFLFGPRFTVRQINKVTPFVQALFGDARVTPGRLGWPYENVFAMALGGGLDIKVYKNLSFRPIQLEYMPIKLGKPYSDNIRYNIGISYSFGSVSR